MSRHVFAALPINGPMATARTMHMAALAFAAYGAVCFVKADIVSYMFLKSQFVFFDFEKSAVFVFFEYTAMMGMWVFIGCYTAKGLRATLLKKG